MARERGDLETVIAAWLAARSALRGLPAPVRDASGALRVETGMIGERRRYLFAEIMPSLRPLLEAIDERDVFVKICAADEDVRPILPICWRLLESRFVMVGPAEDERRHSLPAGYHGRVLRSGQVFAARIEADDGAVAATGHAILHGSVFVYDRIETASAHRRRGLGTAIMTLLGQGRSGTAALPVLVATGDGRSLYERMGWRNVSPYATAAIG